MHLTYHKWEIITEVAFPQKLRHKTGMVRGERFLPGMQREMEEGTGGCWRMVPVCEGSVRRR